MRVRRKGHNKRFPTELWRVDPGCLNGDKSTATGYLPFDAESTASGSGNHRKADSIVRSFLAVGGELVCGHQSQCLHVWKGGDRNGRIEQRYIGSATAKVRMPR